MASVGPHYPALVRRLTAIMRDRETALDLAQETYLRAYRAWDRFDGADERAWLYTIGLRLAFNERRRLLRWRGLLNRPPSDPPWVVRRTVGSTRLSAASAASIEPSCCSMPSTDTPRPRSPRCSRSHPERLPAGYRAPRPICERR